MDSDSSVAPSPRKGGMVNKLAEVQKKKEEVNQTHMVDSNLGGTSSSDMESDDSPK